MQNRWIGVSVVASLIAFVFFGLMVRQCQSEQTNEQTIARIKQDNTTLENEKLILKDTISVQYRLLAERNETIGKLEKKIAAGDLKAAKDLSDLKQEIVAKNQVIDALAEDKQKALALAASLKRGYITQRQADDNLKKSGPAFGSPEADKNIAKLGQEADELKQGLTDTSKSLGQKQEELNQSKEIERQMREVVTSTRIVVVNRLITVVRKRQALKGPKGWFRGGQKRLLDEETTELQETDSQLEKALNKK